MPERLDQRDRAKPREERGAEGFGPARAEYQAKRQRGARRGKPSASIASAPACLFFRKDEGKIRRALVCPFPRGVIRGGEGFVEAHTAEAESFERVEEVVYGGGSHRQGL